MSTFHLFRAMKLKKIGIVIGIIVSALIIFWLIDRIFTLFIFILFSKLYIDVPYPILLFVTEPIKFISVGIFISWAIGRNGKLLAVATTSVLALAAGTISVRMTPKVLPLYLLQPICATMLWLSMGFIGSCIGQMIKRKKDK